MLICCYTHIDRQWTEQELNEKLFLLPDSLHGEALRKRQWIDKQLNITGKLLLIELLKQFNLPLSLSELEYNTHHRPYFDNNFDFNIAHSGNFAICCGTDAGKVGIDIEQVKPINLNDYIDHFTNNEWRVIRSYQDIVKGFYIFWTRKEALLKAIGTGFHTPLSSVEVSGDTVTYDGVTYYIQQLNIVDGYVCHIAATTQPIGVKLLVVNL
ncbi:4'-phosphopantetheinyl transferase family protein [Mucilaginibacter sp.]|jgi:4'-phosphopantetheinyl transferase|uniref:4'-phosphopantetheinyl transferase family protein n=1 Tax=Mucilaginibacter sp. TaxID=1882438 RepID=UPI002CBD3C3E|nr:4'-phosphopantetheinyl transferase superfamily protein [Mucilaginibacter sp.]HTI57915.1 4'-phosphopantetheinyl transferase superfamily protein [Mucilaginibacter sp.]